MEALAFPEPLPAPTVAAILVAEIGDVTRFRSAAACEAVETTVS
jgi:hypothetical protein